MNVATNVDNTAVPRYQYIDFNVLFVSRRGFARVVNFRYEMRLSNHPSTPNVVAQHCDALCYPPAMPLRRYYIHGCTNLQLGLQCVSNCCDYDDFGGAERKYDMRIPPSTTYPTNICEAFSIAWGRWKKDIAEEILRKPKELLRLYIYLQVN